MRLRWRSHAMKLGVVLYVFSSGASMAQTNAVGSARPTIAAVRIDVSEAPVIDADLSDPAWAKAAVLEDFRQRQPVSGAPASERTVLRIMYDENNLYFGVYAYDSEPELVTIRTMARDGAIWAGDNILILLDPGMTRRNAYAFQIGPSGGRQDALRLNNSEELNQWDTIWSVRARLVSDGWVVEIAIPFRSLSYLPGQSDWGFEFARSIRRKNENLRWASLNPALAFTDVSQSGTLTGLTGINEGFGLDLQPYVVTGAKHNWQLPGDGAGITGSMGGNAFYKITPALTGTLTLNTDFSDAPLDARQVNTTRFSLFTAETRDFFLQDAGTFEFGGRGFARGFADRTANNARPFFSRNIGLAGGVPVTLIVGGKVSGEYAGFGIGALSVLTDSTPTSARQILSTVRVTKPVLAESKLGFVMTNGDPTGTSENTVAGVDFQYRDSNFLGGTTFLSDIYYQRSFSSTKGEDDSFAVALNFPNEPWGGDFTFKQVGSNFDPTLGFINRTGIRLYDGAVSNLTRYQGDFLRELNIVSRHQVVTGLDNAVQSREHRVFVEVESQRNDIVQLYIANIYEDVATNFDLPGSLPVLAGQYDWTVFGGFFQTSQGRRAAFRAQIECCKFFDGDGVNGLVQLNLRPNQYFEGQFAYRATFIDLPRGTTEVHLLSFEATLNFTPDMQIAMQAQYDNISEAFGSLARFRWQFSPGSEFFVSLGQTALISNSGSYILARSTQFTMRLSRTFRF